MFRLLLLLGLDATELHRELSVTRSAGGSGFEERHTGTDTAATVLLPRHHITRCRCRVVQLPDRSRNGVLLLLLRRHREVLAVDWKRLLLLWAIWCEGLHELRLLLMLLVENAVATELLLKLGVLGKRENVFGSCH